MSRNRPSFRRKSESEIGSSCSDRTRDARPGQPASSFLNEPVFDHVSCEGAADSNSRFGTRNGTSHDQVRPISQPVSGFPHVKVPAWKAILDLTIVVVSSPIWIPLMLLTMLCVRLGSPGPIFFRQERIGLAGNRFFMWKLRTMKVAADRVVHEQYLEELIRQDRRMIKLDALGDQRLIPFGRILRASGLDELPQIFNVLRREMSLVGPRPSLPNEWAVYRSYHQGRVQVLPGVTGFWQVNGKNNTTFEEMIAMDLSYRDNMSLILDLKILAMTGRPIIAQLLECRDHGSNQFTVRQ